MERDRAATVAPFRAHWKEDGIVRARGGARAAGSDVRGDRTTERRGRDGGVLDDSETVVLDGLAARVIAVAPTSPDVLHGGTREIMERLVGRSMSL